MTGYDDNNNYYGLVYTNDGKGNFNTSFTLYHKPGAGSVALQDIDNDGDIDLIITGETNGGFISEIYTNNGIGKFYFKTSITPGVQESSLAFVDIDNDNDWDLIITGDTGSSSYSKIFKNKNGEFEPFADLTPWLSKSSVAAGDIDNDGDFDLIYDWFGLFWKSLYLCI